MWLGIRREVLCSFVLSLKNSFGKPSTAEVGNELDGMYFLRTPLIAGVPLLFPFLSCWTPLRISTFWLKANSLRKYGTVNILLCGEEERALGVIILAVHTILSLYQLRDLLSREPLLCCTDI